MSKVTIVTNNVKAEFDLFPSTDILNCIVKATLAAVPCFMQSFMSCISTPNTPDGFTPGDRVRCEQ